MSPANSPAGQRIALLGLLLFPLPQGMRPLGVPTANERADA